MSFRTVIAASLLCATLSGESCFGQGGLQMGMNGVGWEANTDSGPLLFREVPEADIVSVRAKISSQTAGFWSRAGVIVRAPNPIDAAPTQEDWIASTSWRVSLVDNMIHRATLTVDGAQTLSGAQVPVPEDMSYMRLDRTGPGAFQSYRGVGADDDHITWTAIPGGPQTNAGLVGATLQVGVQAGDLGGTGGSTVWDWVQIQTLSQTYRDDFNYVHDFSGGVPGFNGGATSGGAIWNGVENAALGGVSTNAGTFVCTTCTWGRGASGDFNDAFNWQTPLASPPNGNTVSAIFGAGGPANVYTNKNVVLKQIDFDDTDAYLLGGAGSFTLDADTGDALINVLQGSHQISADLFLNDNVVATTAAGTTLNINAAVYLNGKTFTPAGAGTINLNNGTVASGSPGPGAGAVVNHGNLAGLAGVEGDFTQTAGGSLAVVVGGSPVQISGDAALDGVLNVSLANGFAPAPGATYTVLTADSVTNQGLSLAGESAGLFQLLVGGGSVSLVAAAIPEPSSVALMVLGALGAGLVRRRRRAEIVTFGGATLKWKMTKYLLFAVGLISFSATSTAWAQVPIETRIDNFDVLHDYTTGTVPVGGIWNGVHNPTNGGDGSPGCTATGACLVSNGVDFNSVAHPGKLFAEDLVLHQNTDASFGIGWEAGPDKNNAPMLHTDFSGTPGAQYDFDAVLKIDSQPNGAWSYAAIVVRVAGPPVGIGPGDPAFTAAENHVTAGSFRPGANVANGEYLLQNTVNGDGNNLAEYNFGLAPAGAAGTLPTYIRLRKRGAVFTGDSSLDGVNWFVEPIGPDNDPNFVTNVPLNIPGQTLEIGPSFMTFPGGVGGAAEFDFFELKLYEATALTSATWKVPRSGNWQSAAGWTTGPIDGQVPNHNTVGVTFGPVPTTPTTIYNDLPTKVKSLTFNNVNKYAIIGAAPITLEADADSPSITVSAGSHEIQSPVVIAASAPSLPITAAAGTRLDFDNSFDFTTAGKTVTVGGGGRVNFNNNADLAVDGILTVQTGTTVGGTGRLNARLNNNGGGTVAPGTSAGTLTVAGQYVQNSTSTLAIEIGGTAANAFDKLVIQGTGASLLTNGLLNVSLINGFVPAPTDTFQILTAGNFTNNTRFGNTTAAPNNILTFPGGSFKVNYVYGTNGTVTLSNFLGAGGVPGDYNGNGVVDAADYVVWRNTLGTNVTPGTGADGDGNGIVQDADHTFWKQRFGNTSASSSANGTGIVPEPTSIALLLFAAIPVFGWLRRHRLARVLA